MALFLILLNISTMTQYFDKTSCRNICMYICYAHTKIQLNPISNFSDICKRNLTTSLRRTLSPVCQQNVKKCNKCRKHSWSVNRSAAKSKFRCFLYLLRRRQFRRFRPKRAKRFAGCTSRSVGLSKNVQIIAVG